MNRRYERFEHRAVALVARFGLLCAGWTLLLGVTGPARAHDGHDALPAKGATVQGDQLLLSAQASQALGMTTAKVTLGSMRSVVRANGRIEVPWQRHAYVTTLVSGRIAEVLVRPGELVRQGQPLLRVESAELERLQLELLQAVQQRHLADKVLSQRTELVDSGVIAGKSLLETRTRHARLAAEVEVARQKLLALGIERRQLEAIEKDEELLDAVTVTALISGLIAHADVRVGELVEPTQHLYQIVDPSQLWVVAEVLESDMSDVRLGQSVTVRFSALPNDVIRGRVNHIHIKVNPERRTTEVIVIVDNQDGTLRPGLFGRVALEAQANENAIICPKAAVLVDDEGPYVLLERRGGKYLRRRVELGIRSGERVEIRDGLFPGDRVVVQGNYVLASLFGGHYQDLHGHDHEHGHDAHDTQDHADHDDHDEEAHEHDPQHDPPASPSHVSTKSSPTSTSDASPNVIAAQGVVELPTSAKTFASSRVEGKLSRILVEHGEFVEQGQPLVEIDSLRVRSMQLDLRAAQYRVAWLDETLSRVEPLAKAKTYPEQQLWQLRADRDAAANEVRSLRRQLTLFGFEADQREPPKPLAKGVTSPAPAARPLIVRAPQDGWIADFDLVPGQVVGAMEPLFEIHDLQTVWIKCYLFEDQAVRVQAGARAEIRFVFDADLAIEGRVVRVAPVPEGAQHVTAVWIEVANPENRLLEGMLARVKIEAEPSAVPVAAVPQ